MSTFARIPYFKVYYLKVFSLPHLEGQYWLIKNAQGLSKTTLGKVVSKDIKLKLHSKSFHITKYVLKSSLCDFWNSLIIDKCLLFLPNTFISL
jgi:hypothetical protein